MNDYAAWRSRVMHGTRGSPPPLPRDSNPTFSVGATAPPAPHPPQPPLPSTAYPSTYVSGPSAATPPPPLASLAMGENFGMTSSKLVGHVTDDPTATVARLQAVLRDICATERRQEKTWLNVQPCVLHAVKLLVATAQTHAMRAQQMEDALQQLQQYTSVLVRDREVKEERYRLDAAAHREEADELWKRLIRLEAEQQAPSQQSDQRTPEAAKERLEEIVEARIAPLRQELLDLRQRLKAVELPHPHTPLHHRRVRSRSAISVSSTLPARGNDDLGGCGAIASQGRHRSAASSSSSTSPSFTSSPTPSLVRHGECPRRGGGATTGVPALTPHSSPRALAPAAAAASPGTQKVKREVQRLRRQWRHFLASLPDVVTQCKDSSDGGEEGCSCHSTNLSPSRRWPRASSKGVRRNSPERISGVTRARVEGAESAYENAPRPLCLPACPSSCALKDARAAACCFALPASGRRVRWYWTGDAQSHFSTAIRRADNGFAASPLPHARPRPALSGVSPALPWTECHAFDGRTDCWYNLGTWATYRRHLHQVEQALEEAASGKSDDARLGWMAWASSLISWPEASAMLVERAGIYAVRVCLVRHCASASLCSGAGRAEAGSRDDCCGGALTLWLNGAAVAGVREVATHTLLYARSAASSAEAAVPWRTTQGNWRHACASAGERLSAFDGSAYSPALASPGGSPVRRRAHSDISDATLRQRPCCEPAQLHTNTLTACLFLPAGATLQVRCRGLHDTKMVHEAFCELEHIV
ncbi:hypothetical protein LSCM1_02151 [Leishmania martiniquensis]|uniref:Uncharacterized protein n=1 Tax=Leishmania martiniquensis TaxID=1580590 RepID=A0A836H0K1_9TRYP|nr:hypothetical protein LSCM1_02151 [Leishmania martiniquensis]